MTGSSACPKTSNPNPGDWSVKPAANFAILRIVERVAAPTARTRSGGLFPKRCFMEQFSRREFVVQGGLGLAALGAGGLVLRADARPTPASGKLGAYKKYLKEKPGPAARKAGKWQPTEDNILGPFYRKGAPYRA